jgi:hypothetical protein
MMHHVIIHVFISLVLWNRWLIVSRETTGRHIASLEAFQCCLRQEPNS